VLPHATGATVDVSKDLRVNTDDSGEGSPPGRSQPFLDVTDNIKVLQMVQSELRNDQMKGLTSQDIFK
jgi:hypothetical protein